MFLKHKDFLFLLTASTRTFGIRDLLFTATTVIFLVRWEEFINRERYFSENITRVFSFTLTFFCRNTEVISRNEHLNVTFKLNNCKYTKCNSECSFAVRIIVKTTIKATTNMLWNIAITTVRQSIATIANSADFSVKHYGVNALHLGFRVRVCNGHLLIRAVANVTRCKDFNISVATVENALFVECYKTFNCARW